MVCTNKNVRKRLGNFIREFELSRLHSKTWVASPLVSHPSAHPSMAFRGCWPPRKGDLARRGLSGHADCPGDLFATANADDEVFVDRVLRGHREGL